MCPLREPPDLGPEGSSDERRDRYEVLTLKTRGTPTIERTPFVPAKYIGKMTVPPRVDHIEGIRHWHHRFNMIWVQDVIIVQERSPFRRDLSTGSVPDCRRSCTVQIQLDQDGGERNCLSIS